MANMFRSYEQRPSVREWHRDMYNVDDEDELFARSAILWPEKFAPAPLLLLHGTADMQVDFHDSVELAAKLTNLNYPVHLELIEGGDHSLSSYREIRTRLEREWLRKYLVA
jgi:dipeptidyl aminopeptidase/acylaminoacyl peptidase